MNLIDYIEIKDKKNMLPIRKLKQIKAIKLKQIKARWYLMNVQIVLPI